MNLKKIREEIEFRNKNKLKNYNLLLKKFNSRLNLYENKNQVEKCKQILKFIRQDKNINEDLKKNYHTLRVAYYCLNFKSNKNNLDICKLALVHNVFENNTDIQSLKKLIDNKTYKLAKVLQVNRKKQWNKNYIKSYYKRLNLSHKNAKIVKSLDKFDNLFSLFKNPKKKVKEKYLQEINKFVLPLVEKFLPNILHYYKSLIIYNINLIR